MHPRMIKKKIYEIKRAAGKMITRLIKKIALQAGFFD